MSSEIDNRVVSLSFDNKKFSEGIKDTLLKLNDFNKKFDFDKIAKKVSIQLTNIKNILSTKINEIISSSSSLLKKINFEPIKNKFLDLKKKISEINFEPIKNKFLDLKKKISEINFEPIKNKFLDLKKKISEINFEPIKNKFLDLKKKISEINFEPIKNKFLDLKKKISEINFDPIKNKFLDLKKKISEINFDPIKNKFLDLKKKISEINFEPIKNKFLDLKKKISEINFEPIKNKFLDLKKKISEINFEPIKNKFLDLKKKISEINFDPIKNKFLDLKKKISEINFDPIKNKFLDLKKKISEINFEPIKNKFLDLKKKISEINFEPIKNKFLDLKKKISEINFEPIKNKFLDLKKKISEINFDPIKNKFLDLKKKISEINFEPIKNKFLDLKKKISEINFDPIKNKFLDLKKKISEINFDPIKNKFLDLKKKISEINFDPIKNKFLDLKKKISEINFDPIKNKFLDLKKKISEINFEPIKNKFLDLKKKISEINFDLIKNKFLDLKKKISEINFDPIKNKFLDLKKKISEINFEPIKNKFLDLKKKISEINFEPIKNKFLDLKKKISEINFDLIKNKFLDLKKKISEINFDPIKNKFLDLKKKISEINFEPIKNKFLDLKKKISEINFEPIKNKFLDLKKKISGINFEPIKNKFLDLKKKISEINFEPIKNKFLDLKKKISEINFEPIKNKFLDLKKKISEINFDPIKNKFLDLKKKISEINFEPIKNKFLDLKKKISEINFEPIKNKFLDLKKKISEINFEPIKNKFLDLKKKISEINFEPIKNKFLDLKKKISEINFEPIKNKFLDLKKKISEINFEPIKNKFLDLKKKISEINFEPIKNKFLDLKKKISEINFEPIKNKFLDLKKKISEINFEPIKNKFLDLKKKISEINFEPIKNKFLDLKKKISEINFDPIKNKFLDLTNFISLTAIPKITQSILHFKKTAISAFSEVFEKIKKVDFANSIKTGFSNIKTVGTNVFSKLSDVAHNFISKLPNISKAIIPVAFGLASVATVGLKIKKNLQLKNSANNLNDLGNTARNAATNFNGLVVASGETNSGLEKMGAYVDSVKERFSILKVVAITALANITNSAVNAGKQLVKSLSVDQISQGWNKYQQKTSSVQTIINSTGMSIDEVNEVLDQLIWFSDETSYSLTDMTAALAQMSSAGGDVKKLIPLITGVANATAFAGKGASEFSRAMYNLNQSYSAGALKFIDWKSLEFAGVTSKALRQVFIDTGVAMGKIKKGEVTVNNFASTLHDNWADTSVMEAAFGKFSELSQAAYNLVRDGEVKLADGTIFKADAKTAAQAITLLADKYDSLAVSAFKSAQEAKSFTEAIVSTKDAVSSEWLNTFEIIFGNYEEAKELWTDLADSLWEVFVPSVRSRNKILKEWKSLGGRKDLIESFWNAWEAVEKIITPIKEAFRDIFPATTTEQLVNATSKLKDFTEKLKISEETAEKIKRAFKGLFSIFDIFKKVISTILKPIGQLISSEGFGSLINFILDLSAAIGDFFTNLNANFSNTSIAGTLSQTVTYISTILSDVITKIKNFGSNFSNTGDIISDILNKIGDGFKKVFGWLSENISIKGILGTITSLFAFLSSKRLLETSKGIKSFFKNTFGNTEDFELKTFAKIFDDLLSSVKKTLQSFTSGIKISSIVAISISIGILTASLSALSKLKIADTIKSLSAMGLMLAMLSKTLKVMVGSINEKGGKGLIGASFSLILIATAVNTLAKAIEKIGNLQLSAVAKGIVGVGAGLFILVKGVKAIDKIKIPFRTSISIIALAKACSILGDALKKFGEMTWGAIARGLAAMGSALAELVVATKYLDKKFGLLNAISIDIIVLGLSKLADALAKFGTMSWEQITRGLVTMGLALLEVSKFSSVITKLGKWSALLGSITIDIIILGLNKLANALAKFGEMSWEQITRGLVAMGVALLEVSKFSSVIIKLGKWSALLGSITIDIIILGLNKLADALTKFGSMSWDEVWRGLVAMGGALGELGLSIGLIGKLARWSGLLGGIIIDTVILGLNKLADALVKLGSMSWDEVWRGLVAMGGALAEIGVVSGVLGHFTNFAGLLGSASLWVAIQGINDLADALVKLGSMSWDEIGRGLAAMVGALVGIGWGSLFNTLSILGSVSINLMAKPLGDLADSMKKWEDVKIPEGLGLKLGFLAAGIIPFTADIVAAASIALIAKPLGDLADSIKKWKDVNVPDGLGGNLLTLADGVFAFTLDTLGAATIGIVAKPLGDMADSMKKWEDVSIPDEIGTGLKSIAEGIGAFSFVFVGGWVLNDIIQPLGELPASLKEWSNITFPDKIKEKLTDIADGVKEFSFGFLGGYSIGTIIDPLSRLPDAFSKWNDINFPNEIQTQLTDLAKGVKEFSGMFGADSNFATVSGAMVKLATALSVWGTIAISDTIATDLTNISKGVKSFDDIGDISFIVQNTRSLVNSMMSLSGINFNAISYGLSCLNAAITAFDSTKISQLGKSIIDGIVNGLTDGATKVDSAISTLTSSCEVALQDVSFYDIGTSLVDGFANGITDQTFVAEAAAKAMARSAYLAAKRELAINSPSKKFKRLAYSIPEGTAVGIDSKIDVVKSSAVNMAKAAIDSTKGTISKLGSILSNNNINAKPTISPVVDATNLDPKSMRLGAKINASVGRPVESIYQAVFNAQRDIKASNEAVMSAVESIRADINDMHATGDQEIALYVDSKKLATSLAKPMNRQLNILSKRGAY